MSYNHYGSSASKLFGGPYRWVAPLLSCEVYGADCRREHVLYEQTNEGEVELTSSLQAREGLHYDDV